MDKQVPNILIVDDDLNITGTFRDILELRNFNPIIASSQNQAISQVKEHHIDVALIDLRLGKESGLEVLRDIKMYSPDTECILFTGYATQNSAIEAIQLGAFGYFQKPIDIEQLLLSIQRALEKHIDRETLKKNEARFHALIQNASDLIVVIDANGIVQYVSPSINHILEYTEQECLGRNFLEWVHPDDVPAALESFASRSKKIGMAKNAIQIRGLHKNGTWRVVEVLGINLLAEPAIQGIVMNMRDVTESRAVDATLRENEERYRRLFENAPVGIFSANLEGKIIEINPAALHILGSPSIEATKSINLLTFPLLVKTGFSANFKACVESGRSVFAEQSYTSKWGKSVYAQYRMTPILDFSEQLSQVQVIIEDITERKQAEEALHQSEKRYRGLFEDPPIAIWEEDFSGVKKYIDALKQQGVTDFRKYFELHPDATFECSEKIKILDVNNSALQMFGAESKEALINHTNSGQSKGEAEHNPEDFIAIAEGKTSNSWEGSDESMTGEPIEINLSWSVVPGYENDYSKVIVTTLDITQRKQAETSLRDSEEKFRHLVDSMDGIVWEADAQTFNFTYASKQAERLTGYSVPEWLTPGFWIDHLHPDDKDKTIQYCVTCTEQMIRHDFEYRFIGKDGRIIWLRDIVSVFAEEGKPRWLRGLMVDITHQREMAEALATSESELLALFAAMNDVVLVIDREGVYREIAPTNPDLLIASPVELLGKTLWDVFPAEQAEAFIIVMRQVLLTHQTAHIEYKLEINKKTVWFETSISIMNADSTVWVAHDVTWRKLVEEQLNLQSSALHAAANAIVITDRKGAIKWANPAFSKLTGYTLDEAVDKNPRDLIKSGKHESGFYKKMWETILAGEVWQGEIINRRKDGSLYTEELTITPVRDEAGSVDHFIAVKQDISGRKRSDDEIHQHVTELELLYESGLAFSHMLSPKEIGQQILDLLDQKMDWHHTTIRLFNPQDESMELIAFHQAGVKSEAEKLSVGESFNKRIATIDDGLTGWAIQQSRTLRIGNVTQDPHYIATVPGINSGLYVPIKLGERIIGAISIESEEENAFSEADERLTYTLANQAANALENARLFDETRQRILELTMLHRAGQTLLAARLNPEEIYEAVHQAVQSTMACDAFVIVLDEEDSDEYHAVYFFDKGERYPSRWLPHGSGLSGRVIGSGETLLIEDTHRTHVEATHFGTKDSTRSILAVPLRRGNRIGGMLSTQSYQPKAFGDPQRVLLETIGAQLASALDNAHLYQQTELRIKELETLYIVSSSMRTIRDMDEALTVLLDNILSILETTAGSILLYDPISKELKDQVTRGWFTGISSIPIKSGEGVAGTVFANGEAYYSAEFIHDTLPHASTRMQIPAGWGGVCLPIHASTGIIGVMFVSVQLPRQINKQQIKLLDALMEMAGTAIQRMRLNNETARRAEEFASLYEMSKALSVDYDLNSLFKVIVERAREMLNASVSAIYLYDAENYELVLTAHTTTHIPIGSRLGIGEGMAGRVAQTRQPIRIDDYSTWKGRASIFDGFLINAVIEVPMLYAGEMIGVLVAEEMNESTRKFTDADERLFSLFASQAAGAINAARHREDTLRHAQELEQRVIERTTEIEATRQRLDLAASAGGIGVWELNLINNKVFWDTRMFLIHNVHPNDFDNMLETWWQMIHPQDLPATQKQFELALQRTGLFTDEHRIILSDGSVRFVTANAIVLYDADHRPERLVGVNVDVTERKQAEDALQHANYEMERALRTKDEFLATMSHELRTPLNAILGISESLEEQMSGPLNEKQLKYTGIIRESGRHLLELINDILDISKIEAGRMELELQNFSVDRVCQSSMRLIKRTRAEKEPEG